MPEPPAVGCGGGGGTTAAVEVSELVAGGVTTSPVIWVAALSAAESLLLVIGGAGVPLVIGGAGVINLSIGPVAGAAGTESWFPLPFLGLPFLPGAAPIKKGYF